MYIYIYISYIYIYHICIRCSLSATRNKEGNRESYVMVDSAGESVRNSRPRNEIVFKPNVQPDVFSQVAKQSGQVPKP